MQVSLVLHWSIHDSVMLRVRQEMTGAARSLVKLIRTEALCRHSLLEKLCLGLLNPQAQTMTVNMCWKPNIPQTVSVNGHVDQITSHASAPQWSLAQDAMPYHYVTCTLSLASPCGMCRWCHMPQMCLH